jgi:hypothetical protein
MTSVIIRKRGATEGYKKLVQTKKGAGSRQWQKVLCGSFCHAKKHKEQGRNTFRRGLHRKVIVQAS